MSNPVQIVQGGLWGSESKGAIAAYLCQKDKIDYATRTGATNAGHTVVYKETRVVLQQLPVGFVNPDTILVLGAGALIDIDILKRECAMLSELTGTDIRDRLKIDYRAFIHRDIHHDRSTQSGRHHAIGATGKGCSEALMDRIRLRGSEDWRIGPNVSKLGLGGYDICDTERLLNWAWDEGAHIQLEGTQGQLLDLYLGPYPYTTHKQTGPAQWMLECGLSPSLPTNIVMVVRTYPIRVAGNSGPLADEISWPMLAREINGKRAVHGLPPIVDESDITEFEDAVRAVSASRSFHAPNGSDGLDQHTWSPADRHFYRRALSEINAVALGSLSEGTVDRLRALFELTTVTRKLRRVARLNMDTLAEAARQVRPSQIAVTFINYEFPERWYSSSPITGDESRYLAGISKVCYGAPVTLINRGPDPSHICEVA